MKTRKYWLSLGFAAMSLGSVYASVLSHLSAIVWPMYHSQEMVFSVRKPPEWKTVRHGEFVLFLHNVPQKGSVFACIGTIPAGYYRDVFIKEQGLSELYQPGYRKYTRPIKGYPSLQLEGTYQSEPKGRLLEVLITGHGKTYQLTFFVPEADMWNEYLPTFNNILSSFKPAR